MKPILKSDDFKAKSSHARKLMHLNDDNNKSQKMEEEEENPDEGTIVCEQIADEIYQSGVMTINQINFILKNPELVPIFNNMIPDVILEIKDDFQLENEYKMVEACLNKIAKIPVSVNLLFDILLPNCKTNTIKNLILDVCLKNIDNSNYSKVFELYIDKYPSEDMWPWVLKMKDGYELPAMHLLFYEIFPKDKKAIIEKIKNNPTKEDMNFLGLLQLTKEEFIQENIFELVLKNLQTSHAYIIAEVEDMRLINDEEVKIRDGLAFIGNRMIELNLFNQDFVDFAIDLMKTGSLYLVQSSANFLYNISNRDDFHMPIESITSMIQPEIVEKILDLIDSCSTNSVIESSLNLILIFLEKCPDEVLPLLDFDYLSSLLNSIAENNDSFNTEIERIFKFFQTDDDDDDIQ